MAGRAERCRLPIDWVEPGFPAYYGKRSTYFLPQEAAEMIAPADYCRLTCFMNSDLRHVFCASLSLQSLALQSGMKKGRHGIRPY